MDLRNMTEDALWHLWRSHIDIADAIRAELDHRDREFARRKNRPKLGGKRHNVYPFKPSRKP